jgi:hypothetical protein
MLKVVELPVVTKGTKRGILDQWEEILAEASGRVIPGSGHLDA